MSTSERVIIETGRRRRRRHSAQFKAEAIGACQQPGVSVASVALARGLNANMLRNWVRIAERSRRPIAIQPAAPMMSMAAAEGFIPMALPTGATQGAIRVEVRRNGKSVSIEWPVSAARDCALLLQDIMK